MVLISYSGSSWPRVNTRTGEIFSTSSKNGTQDTGTESLLWSQKAEI
uniref:Uncharacterized protein n=1 Tax=Anguilla anguilla TaxID=7936 RepID=A0A0E9V3T0_ANGAN